jgi:hypothetical protein
MSSIGIGLALSDRRNRDELAMKVGEQSQSIKQLVEQNKALVEQNEILKGQSQGWKQEMEKFRIVFENQQSSKKGGKGPET